MIFSQACRRLHNGGTLDVDMSLFDTVNLPYQFSWIVSTHEIKNSTNIFHHVFTCTDYSMKIQLFLNPRKLVHTNVNVFTAEIL